MADETPEQGSLERLGIDVQTQLPDNILTPGSAKSVQFRVSEPRGYFFKDVEDFIANIVSPTLEAFAQALHARDNDVYRLGEELDRSEVDRVNLRFQLAAGEYGSTIQKGVKANEDDKEMAELLQRYESLKTQLETTKASLEASETYTAQQDAYIDALLAAKDSDESDEPEEAPAEVDVPAEEEPMFMAPPAPAYIEPEVEEPVQYVEPEPVEGPAYVDVEPFEPEYIEPEPVQEETYNQPPAPASAYAEPVQYVEPEPVAEPVSYEPEPEFQIEPEVTSQPKKADEDNYHPVYGKLPPGINPNDL